MAITSRFLHREKGAMRSASISAIRKGIWLVLTFSTIAFAGTEGISPGFFKDLMFFYGSMCESHPVDKEMDVPEIREGSWVRFEDGKKYLTGECQNRKAEGKWLIIHDHGGTAVEAFFREGKPEGVWRFWHYKGRKVREEEYQNGMRHGRLTKWSQYNGQVVISGQYREDLEDGKWIYWNGKGEIEKEELWESGKRIPPP
jgi:hypothetical protein